MPAHSLGYFAMQHLSIASTRNSLAALLLAVCCAVSSSALRAETLDTNNPDIVVKRVYCLSYGLGGVLVNKGGKPFRGSLAVAVRDEEGDIVGRSKQRLRVGAENGARFDYYYINTLDCRKHTFDFTVN
jgi:hypothetical protein